MKALCILEEYLFVSVRFMNQQFIRASEEVYAPRLHPSQPRMNSSQIPVSITLKKIILVLWRKPIHFGSLPKVQPFLDKK
jgi:hypothetical protein